MRKPKRFHVYIMTNRPRSHVLYTGITGNLARRVFQHKNKLVPGFTSRTTSRDSFSTSASFIRMPQSPAKRRLRGGGEARRFGSSNP